MFSFRNFVLPSNKELSCALQLIKGVGFWKSNFILSKFGFSFPFFLGNLNFYYFLLITFLLKNLVLSEVRVNRILMFDIKLLISINSRRGLRHVDYLPVRGQRTRSNAGVRKRLRFSL